MTSPAGERRVAWVGKRTAFIRPVPRLDWRGRRRPVWRLKEDHIGLPTFINLMGNSCLNCCKPQGAHDPSTRMSLPGNDCKGWNQQCLVCEQGSSTAWVVYTGTQLTRTCRDCRRYVKHKEKELWQKNFETLQTRRDLTNWRRGRRFMTEVKKLLNPEHSQLRASGFELAPTSPIS